MILTHAFYWLKEKTRVKASPRQNYFIALLGKLPEDRAYAQPTFQVQICHTLLYVVRHHTLSICVSVSLILIYFSVFYLQSDKKGTTSKHNPHYVQIIQIKARTILRAKTSIYSAISNDSMVRWDTYISHII